MYRNCSGCLARVVTKASRFSRSIPLLKAFKYRLQFKICTFVFRYLNDGQPSYSSSLFFLQTVKHLRLNNTNKLKVGERVESWATYYILTPFALPICHIILFPVVLRSTDHAKQSELYFILYALCCIGKKCD